MSTKLWVCVLKHTRWSGGGGGDWVEVKPAETPDCLNTCQLLSTVLWFADRKRVKMKEFSRFPVRSLWTEILNSQKRFQNLPARLNRVSSPVFPLYSNVLLLQKSYLYPALMCNLSYPYLWHDHLGILLYRRRWRSQDFLSCCTCWNLPC